MDSKQLINIFEIVLFALACPMVLPVLLDVKSQK